MYVFFEKAVAEHLKLSSLYALCIVETFYETSIVNSIRNVSDADLKRRNWEITQLRHVQPVYHRARACRIKIPLNAKAEAITIL
uniref:Transposase n=1 Tax=Ascaris lumbricoides TaxID=6252 RepID=A0A0M3IWN1_ASCLU